MIATVTGRNPIRTSNVVPPAPLVLPASLPRPRHSFIHQSVTKILLLIFCPSTPAHNGLLFRRRAPDSVRIESARLAFAGRDWKKTLQEDSMKYLLMIIAALALVGTASATSSSADCCGGGGCCPIKMPCC